MNYQELEREAFKLLVKDAIEITMDYLTGVWGELMSQRRFDESLEINKAIHEMMKYCPESDDEGFKKMVTNNAIEFERRGIYSGIEIMKDDIEEAGIN